MAKFLLAFSIVVTFPYFAPFIESQSLSFIVNTAGSSSDVKEISQWFGISGMGYIGALYALPHLVYLLLAGNVHVVCRGKNWVDGQRILILGFSLLAISGALHLPAITEVLVVARILFGVAMVCCYHGLHLLLSANFDRKKSGQEFSRFDAMSKWGGVAAGLSAAFISSFGRLEVPFYLCILVSLFALVLLLFRFKGQSQTVR